MSRVRGLALRSLAAVGGAAEGWGGNPAECPMGLAGQSDLEERDASVKEFCIKLTGLWASFAERGHPIELGHEFKSPSWRAHGSLQSTAATKERNPCLAWRSSLLLAL